MTQDYRETEEGKRRFSNREMSESECAEYWEEEVRRCTDGLDLPDGVRLSGKVYFYLRV